MDELPFNVRPLVPTAPLSKSKFVHGMQCPLYVWLEVRTDAPRPEVDSFTQALFDVGHEVGELARLRWDQRLAAAGKPAGVLVSEDPKLHDRAVLETQSALDAGAWAVHEAAFTYGGVKVRVDVLERLADGTFAINEVKSTAHYDAKKHLLDAAVQLWVLRGAGLDVTRVRVVHLNGEYEWSGGPYDLEVLFAEDDVTAVAEEIQEPVGLDVERLLHVLNSDQMPIVPNDTSHTSPYGCPYFEVCPALGERVEHPIRELPSCSKRVIKRAAESGCVSLLDIDETAAQAILTYSNGELNDRWYWTWKATATDTRIVLPECPSWIAELEYPLHHLDFETIGAPLPVVVGTRPFQIVPLQYSIHLESTDGAVEHREFMVDALDLDPRRTLIERLLADLGDVGGIIHWSQYEARVIRELAADPRYAAFRDRLLALLPRLKDLGKAVDAWVFDRGFHGRWSLKKVYPVLAPGADADAMVEQEGGGVLSYDELDGVAKGDQAAMALLEYLRPSTTIARRAEIRRQLLVYCKLDTWATVQVLGALRANDRLGGPPVLWP